MKKAFLLISCLAACVAAMAGSPVTPSSKPGYVDLYVSQGFQGPEKWEKVTLPIDKNGYISIFNGKDFDSVAAGEIENIKDIALHMSDARRLVAEMESACAKALAVTDERKKAVIFHDKVTKYLDDIRVHVDALEMIVDDEMWPLPKYRELLFIR